MKTKLLQLRKKKIWLVLLVLFIVIDLQLLGFYLHLTQKASPVQAKEEQMPEVSFLATQDYDFKELTGYFTQLANEKGAVYAYDVLKIASIAPGIDMHLLGHLVGDILYKQKGVEGMKYCTQDFRNACSHSIVVAMFIKDGTKAMDKISDACRKAPGGKGAYTMCFHGLGHGVLAYTDYDMGKAIDLCKTAGTKEYQNREYIECVGGITMEMMSGVNNPGAWNVQKTRFFSESDPLAPCSTGVVPTEVKPICYIYLTPHLFESVEANMNAPQPEHFSEAFTFCNRIENMRFREACFGGFGKEFVVLAQNRDIRKIETMNDSQLQTVYNWCTLAKAEDGIESCVTYALNSLYWGGENDRKVAVQFCSLITQEKQQESCFTNLTKAINNYSYNQSDKATYCQEIPMRYRSTCQEMIKEPPTSSSSL